MSKLAAEKDSEVEIPPECYMVEKIPHDWLFPRIDAVLHHGGAGTTGASLRAGIPTLIKPWFGDQFFWGSRVQKLGVSSSFWVKCGLLIDPWQAGLRVPSLRVHDLAVALTKATTNMWVFLLIPVAPPLTGCFSPMREKAAAVGERIRSVSRGVFEEVLTLIDAC